jgi:hypothetical protein
MRSVVLHERRDRYAGDFFVVAGASGEEETSRRP